MTTLNGILWEADRGNDLQCGGRGFGLRLLLFTCVAGLSSVAPNGAGGVTFALPTRNRRWQRGGIRLRIWRALLRYAGTVRIGMMGHV